MSANDSLKFEDESTPETGKPFLLGYRKFVVALIWLCLAIFVVLWCMLVDVKPGQITLALWVVGSAGFFSAFFVGGNVLVHYWTEFFKVNTQSNLSQTRTEEVKTQYIRYDSSEDAKYLDKEPPEVS